MIPQTTKLKAIGTIKNYKKDTSPNKKDMNFAYPMNYTAQGGDPNTDAST
jgi:hypothetical protein